MKDDWLFKPFVQLGGGKEINTSGGAAIYAAGLRSRGSSFRSSMELILGGELQPAGYGTTDGLVSSLSRTGLGGEAVFPMGVKAAGRPLNFGTYLVYYRYLNDFDTLVPSGEKVKTEAIGDELEIGSTEGTYEERRSYGFPFKRLGLGFRLGQDLRGIRITTGLPF